MDWRRRIADRRARAGRRNEAVQRPPCVGRRRDRHRSCRRGGVHRLACRSEHRGAAGDAVLGTEHGAYQLSVTLRKTSDDMQPHSLPLEHAMTRCLSRVVLGF